ncbi:hypothetical protein B14_01357 [Bacillus licheniformis]|uniref:Uncharacterized protein n=1 Tax=Bacillus licheniformis (strain ATCC 14580 / DSM 13 / JCM 2505 / CCUG 7422 / NBRC 12200 / NCIMB 9375 / NCTC 10341 / NRRL NRS-1264 / Gibson 46) TaxID=279010 RepID=Q65G41_BACLD|nr:hypothetical protein BLi03112 [Bacillus licheniformis DSM 13 = ATCC 14580]APJ28073.1 hypothetical protein BSZ43_15395 [Bacillus sp. H15-1]ARC64358.1 hypothetical protein B14_01357 [Bacillus licheniformis]ASV16498.1 hypothetical protein CJO35_15505 [Bacillus sp. 1s-1]EQM26880.1 hypothetical protein N399_17165 [Bacillus licheniformis CG-B52]MBY8347596.1 hypothetical protein [Bacillus sp. PCH94]
MFACEKVPYSYEAGLFYSGGRISNQDECDHRYHLKVNHQIYQQPESTGSKQKTLESLGCQQF